MAQSACDLKPMKGEFQATLGFAYYRNKQWQSALNALSNSVELKSENAELKLEVSLFLVMTCRQLGNIAEAEKWYQQAAERCIDQSVGAEPSRLFREASGLFEKQAEDEG